MRDKDRKCTPAHIQPAQKFHSLFLFALLFLGFLIYSNTFLSPFNFDDIPSIVDNSAIRHILSPGNIWHFWPTRVITYLSLAFNYHFNQLNVVGYHVFNLAVHLGSAILVWWLSLLTFSTPVMKDQKIARHANLISLFAGLVFVTHPIQTQAVTYIIQRTASLATLFYVASLCFYARSRLSEPSRRWRWWYSGSLIMAVFAMFTKEMTITLPLMICLCEFSFFKTKERMNWRRVLPFLFCLAIIPMTMILTKSVNIGEMRRAGEPVSEISSLAYLLTQFRVVITYIRLLFLPVNQSIDYDYPIANTLLELPVLVSFLALAGIFIIAVRLFRNYRLVSFGIFWFFLALLPESSAIPIKDVIFEHRLYLPMVGFSLFLASGMFHLLGKRRPGAAVVVSLIIVASFSFFTYARNSIWKDTVTFWTDTVRKSPKKARPYCNLGIAYQSRGDFDQAILNYTLAVEKAIYPKAYYNRGLAYQGKENLSQAISDYSKAIEIKPDYANAYYNRGLIYQNKGNPDQAISDYNKAIENEPNSAEAYYNRGLAYQGKGDLDRAILDYSKAIEFKPDYVDAYSNRGVGFAQKGSFDQALSDFSKAIEIMPDGEAYFNRGLVYKHKGNLSGALSDFRKAKTLGYQAKKAPGDVLEGIRF